MLLSHLRTRNRCVMKSLIKPLPEVPPPTLFHPYPPNPLFQISPKLKPPTLLWQVVSHFKTTPKLTSGRPNPTHESEIIHSATYLAAVLHTKYTQFHHLVSTLAKVLVATLLHSTLCLQALHWCWGCPTQLPGYPDTRRRIGGYYS